MKYIEKGNEPRELTNWKNKANEEWQPSYNTLANPQKEAVFNALWSEQGNICCYCERRLVIGDCHIEHFQPQSDLAVDALDFSNILCSCQNRLDKGDPRHCGNLKGSWFDEALLVSPLDFNCEERFSYMGDGGISPKGEDPAATETISRLGLGIPKVNSLRKSAISPFLDDSLTDDELKEFVAGYLQKSGDAYGEFWTTIKYLFSENATT